jgi:hypothetical protein
MEILFTLCHGRVGTQELIHVSARHRSQNSLVFLMTMLQHEPWESGSASGRVKKYFPSLKRQDRIWRLPILLFNGYRRSLAGSEVEHTPPPNVEVKSEWNCVPPLSCVLLVSREIYFLYFTFILQMSKLLHFVTRTQNAA